MGCQAGCQCRANELRNLHVSTADLHRHLAVLEDVGLVTVDEAHEEWSLTHGDGHAAREAAQARHAHIAELLADETAGIT